MAIQQVQLVDGSGNAINVPNDNIQVVITEPTPLIVATNITPLSVTGTVGLTATTTSPVPVQLTTTTGTILTINDSTLQAETQQLVPDLLQQIVVLLTALLRATIDTNPGVLQEKDYNVPDPAFNSITF